MLTWTIFFAILAAGIFAMLIVWFIRSIIRLVENDPEVDVWAADRFDVSAGVCLFIVTVLVGVLIANARSPQKLIIFSSQVQGSDLQLRSQGTVSPPQLLTPQGLPALQSSRAVVARGESFTELQMLVTPKLEAQSPGEPQPSLHKQLLTPQNARTSFDQGGKVAESRIPRVHVGSVLVTESEPRWNPMSPLTPFPDA